MAHNKCLECDNIPCANLLFSENELEGGEFYVLKESIEKGKITPCQPMTPIYTCCLLCQAIRKTLNDEEDVIPPLLFLIWQCLYDFKTSAFLALTAHYRGAIQLLRPVIENILAGLYFEKRLYASSEEKGMQAWDDFSKWSEDEFRISESEWLYVMGKKEEERRRRLGFGFLTEWLIKEKVLTGRGKERLQEIQRQLNKFLHPYFEQMDIGDENCSKCPTTTRYVEDRYYEWLNIFQNIIDFFIEDIFSYYPEIEETEEVVEAIENLEILYELEQELKIPMIKSNYLKERIEAMSDFSKNKQNS